MWSFQLCRRASAISIVGESGCGKSTLAKAMIRLIEPKSGRVEVAGADILGLAPALLRARTAVDPDDLPDPFGSLNRAAASGR